VVYGITTGFGKFARTVIDSDKLEYVSNTSKILTVCTFFCTQSVQ